MIGRLQQRSRRVGQRLRQWWQPGGLILLYHRVAEVAVDPWSLVVTPNHFAEHLEVLKRHYRPVSLAKVAAGGARREERGAKRVERGMVAITFDDGYADNWYNAVPLLSRAGMSATFFVTAGMVGSQRPYWWDELTGMLLHDKPLPDYLDIRIGDGNFSWQLKGVEPTHRGPLYYTLWKCLRPLPVEERELVLDRLRVWAGRQPVGRLDCRPLDREELKALAGTEGMEVGAHTVSHPQLAELGTAEQQREIEESKRCLEERIGREVNGLAYPFGRRGDFTEETVGLVQAAGFGYACTNLAGLVRPESDRYRLPRLYVRDGDGDAFAAWLRKMGLEIGDG
jgi:peptidoglycan/xylan/chitin deacetylase (PgdA/CDA1 family)